MDIAGATHLGRIRTNNEDSYAVSENNGVHLLLVADGMGGYNAGEVASQLAVNVIKDKFAESTTEREEFLGSAIEYANALIIKASTEDKEKSNMGTTIVAAVIDEDDITIANVGDSRAYMLEDNKVSQITEDHSYVQELVRQGILTSEEAATHPRKNLITRVLGGDKETKPDFIHCQWKQGDILLLCSDGLTNHVNDNELYEILHRKGTAQVKAEALINLANARGGKDNITIIIAQR